MNNQTISYIDKTEFAIHQNDLAQIIDRAFDCHGYHESVFEDILSRNKPIIFINKNGKNIVNGFSYGFVERPNHLGQHTKQAILPPLQNADKNGTLAFIKTICILPEFQNHGIATSLFKKTQSQLIENNPTHIVVPAWQAGKRINIKSILEHEAYTQAETIKNYWKQDCDKGSFSCPERTNQCICHSAIFYKEINNGT